MDRDARAPHAPSGLGRALAPVARVAACRPFAHRVHLSTVLGRLVSGSSPGTMAVQGVSAGAVGHSVIPAPAAPRTQ